MAKYKIEWCAVKKEGEKNGKPWKITSMTLSDEHGVMTENVDTFDSVENGFFIEGEIEKGQYGLNFKKAPSPKQVAGANFKAKQIEETMARKEGSIAKFQDSKEWSIKLASSMGKAVDLAIAEKGIMGSATFEERIGYWRKFILDNWEIDPTDIKPF